MKVQFQFTLDDMVDLAQRAVGRSRVAAALRRERLVGAALGAGALGYAIASGATPSHLAAALAAGIAAAVLYPALSRTLRRQRLRQLYRERLGGAGPFSCEVEIAPSGITTTQMGASIKRDWSAISAVEDRGDSIEFVTRGAGTLVVRNRAFESQEAWRAFLDTARGYLAQARQTPPPPAAS